MFSVLGFSGEDERKGVRRSSSSPHAKIICFGIVRSIELEVATCIVVRNVLDHPGERLHIVGQQSFLHIISEQVAEQPAEILMSRIAQEGARVGEHAHEAAKQSEHGERIHLSCHTIELVVEPPSRSELYLTRA